MVEKVNPEKVIEEYIAAYRRANGDRPIRAWHESGWYHVLTNGFRSPYRRKQLVAMTSFLHRRADDAGRPRLTPLNEEGIISG